MSIKAISLELMTPAARAAVWEARTKGHQVTMVVGPDLWSDIMQNSALGREVRASDLIRDGVALPRVMNAPIVDDQALDSRQVVVRSGAWIA